MPDDTLQRLKEGNARFVAGRSSQARSDSARLRLDARTLRPFACVLACSDSRVPVEFVFDQGVGDLFVVRTAGNTAGGHEVASLAFAVGVLGTPLVVVMGHTDCGAIRAAVTGGGVAPMDELAPIIDEIRPAARRVPGADRADPDQSVLDAVARSHVGDVIDLVMSRSPVIAGAVKRGDCRVVGAIYNTRTGRVDFRDGTEPTPCASGRRAEPAR